jgi:hypothetical protein
VALHSLLGPWLPHIGSFVILLRHAVGLLWTSYQPVTKASTYTEQHNTETQRQTSMPQSVFEPTIPATKRPIIRGSVNLVSGLNRLWYLTKHHNISKYRERRLFGPKTDKVTGEWRRLHNKELHNFYSSPNIITQIKTRRMRWARHVACLREREKCSTL